MGRRYEDVEKRNAEQLRAVKQSLLLLPARDRAFILAWLARYFGDDGDLYSPNLPKQRQRIVVDGVDYWLVRVPKRSRRPS